MKLERITYTDYYGEERTEDFYFNLTTAEITEMNLMTTGGMDKQLQKIYDAKDVPKAMSFFKNLILKSYGEKSADGRRFIKSDDISEEFAQTEAYSILFMRLISEEHAGEEFIKGVIPKDLAAKMSEMEANGTLPDALKK